MKRLEPLSERLRVMHEVFRTEQADGPGGEEDASIFHSGLALLPTRPRKNSTLHALKPTDDALDSSGGALNPTNDA